jgi:hypothetical protein
VLPSDTPDHPVGNTKEVSAFLADSVNQLAADGTDQLCRSGQNAAAGSRVATAINWVTAGLIHPGSCRQVGALSC